MKKYILILFIFLTGYCYAQGHFVPAFIGNGQNHMRIDVITATIGGIELESGDEIASFDGSICTGVVVLTQSIHISDFNTFGLIAASQKDVGCFNGYTSGDKITYKLWDKSKRIELSNVAASYIDINTKLPTTELTYSPSETALVKLAASAPANRASVANAGYNQSVNAGEMVTLDGTASADPDNDALTYLWTALVGITLSSTTAPKPTFTSPEVVADTDYAFALNVNDGTLSSAADQVVVTVKQIDQAPLITAFTCEAACRTSIVTVSIIATDAIGVMDYYLVADNSTTPTVGSSGWSSSKPTSIALSTEGSHILYLWAKDVAGNISNVATAVLIYDKTAPVATLSCAATSTSGTVPVTITATDANTITGYYLVSDNITAPAVGTSGWNSSEPTSIALSAEGSHTLYLWVKDVASNISNVVIACIVYNKTFNHFPDANAGVSQIVDEGQLVTLDGSKSSDSDGDRLNYHWTAPLGVTLSSENVSNPTFTAPQITSKTDYEFTLIVSDNMDESAKSYVIVTVNDAVTFSVQRLKSEFSMIAYPNPFDGQVTFEVYDEDEEIGLVSVYNNYGVLIYNFRELSFVHHELKFNWDGTDRYGKPVQSGLYFLKINNHILKLIKK